MKKTTLVEVTSESDLSNMTATSGVHMETVSVSVNEQDANHKARHADANLMMDGYTADIEEACCSEEEEEGVWSEDELATGSLSRKRRRAPPPQQYNTSLVVLSKFLVQYWDAIRVTPPPPPPPKKQKTVSLVDKESTLLLLPQVSCRHVSLEEALAFTPLARILLQAEPPHSVVHANAAYARLCGSDKVIQKHQNTSLMNAIQHSFANAHPTKDMTLTMYPVCSNEVVHADLFMVTHYLIEATFEETVSSRVKDLSGFHKTQCQSSLQTDEHARAVG